MPVMGALFQSRGWLPIVEAPGNFRHPTSIFSDAVVNQALILKLLINSMYILLHSSNMCELLNIFT